MPLRSLAGRTRDLVLATGGGIVTRPENISPCCARSGCVAFLTADRGRALRAGVPGIGTASRFCTPKDPRATLQRSGPTPPRCCTWTVRAFHGGYLGQGSHAEIAQKVLAAAAPSSSPAAGLTIHAAVKSRVDRTRARDARLRAVPRGPVRGATARVVLRALGWPPGWPAK